MSSFIPFIYHVLFHPLYLSCSLQSSLSVMPSSILFIYHVLSHPLYLSCLLQSSLSIKSSSILYISCSLSSSVYIMSSSTLFYHVLLHPLYLSCPPSSSLSIMCSCIPFIYHVRVFPLLSSSPIMYSSILFHVLCSLSSLLSTLHIRSLFSFFFYHVISPLFFTLIKYLLFSLEYIHAWTSLYSHYCIAI